MSHKLTKNHLDALKEIGNIGTGMATTSLAKIFDKPFHMKVPSVSFISFDEMTDSVGGPETLITALFFRLYGAIQGSIYLIFPIQTADYLINKVIKDRNLKWLNDESEELALSTLKEIGNIMMSSYLSALSDFMNVQIKPSIPYMTTDMAQAILTESLIQNSPMSDDVIVIDTKIYNIHSKKNFRGQLFLVPDHDSIEKIFKALGMEML